MIVAILPNISTAEILLNNLSEADFDLADVSVVMRNRKQQKLIAQDNGPLKGTNLRNVAGRLIQAGLSSPDARLYRDAVAEGRVLIAMTVLPESQQAATEMLQSHEAEFIKG